MTPLWHKNEYPPLPDEEKARAAIGALNVPTGDYMLPRCKNMKEYGTPEFQEKLKQGPNWIITVLPPGGGGMAGSLFFWFLFQLLVLLLRDMWPATRSRPARTIHDVFRFVGATGVHGLRARSDAAVHLVQAQLGPHVQAHVRRLDLRCLAAGVFGWLWPK